jgi:hypothetical protein
MPVQTSCLVCGHRIISRDITNSLSPPILTEHALRNFVWVEWLFEQRDVFISLWDYGLIVAGCENERNAPVWLPLPLLVLSVHGSLCVQVVHGRFLVARLVGGSFRIVDRLPRERCSRIAPRLSGFE